MPYTYGVAATIATQGMQAMQAKKLRVVQLAKNAEKCPKAALDATAITWKILGDRQFQLQRALRFRVMKLRYKAAAIEPTEILICIALLLRCNRSDLA